MIQKLLSLPPNLVGTFKKFDTRYDSDEWYCCSDPADTKLGSGAGTAWLLDQWEKDTCKTSAGNKKIIIHAGGQSRRLPAYATMGKVLTPIPVLRWALGEEIDRNLLSMQLPLYERIMEAAPSSATTLIASGDVCIRTGDQQIVVPEADVVCYGMWVDPVLASHHGVFMSRRDNPSILDFMLQKPSVEELNEWGNTHFYLMDIGIWVLSDKAVEILRRRSADSNGNLHFYDLYSQFGCALGSNPSATDNMLNALTVAVVPLDKGEFYHFGTTRELLSSTLALQNRVYDQRLIMQPQTKPNPALFVQNCIIDNPLTAHNDNIWIENSHIGSEWKLTRCNVITGVPTNDWKLTVPEGICLDIEPIGSDDFAVRPYGFDDAMRGAIGDDATMFMGQPLKRWLEERGIALDDPENTDIQSARIFPVVNDTEQMGIVARWLISEPELSQGKEIWQKASKISADGISACAALDRANEQRRGFLYHNIPILADNYQKSVFYQLDLDRLAHTMAENGIAAPSPLENDAPLTQSTRNHMLRSRILTLNGVSGKEDEEKAFELMRSGITATINNEGCMPRLDVCPDQIVWGRSPVRIDLAGGWTDTPPYSLYHGGNVVNMAIELNGQQPLQVFVKPTKQYHIVLRSIDLSASETIDNYTQLLDFKKVGSPFSLPKAALSLAGFAPQFCPERFGSLPDQLKAFGSGIEITLLSAIPAGSGLGTSSILASTILAAVSDFCGLSWDTDEICSRTLALEQLLTTGGGWQDQYGGVLQGIKLLQTTPDWRQRPTINWLPEGIFTDAQYAPCHLLYYTGITRTAKNILGEIVKRMFLNSAQTLSILNDMRNHSLNMARAIQRCDFMAFGSLVGRSWEYNKRLDCGTNPPSVQAIIDRVADYTIGLKLPGAGGGGFIYMVAKDPEAAMRIRQILKTDSVNPNARFVEMSVSNKGTQVSRS